MSRQAGREGRSGRPVERDGAEATAGGRCRRGSARVGRNGFAGVGAAQGDQVAEVDAAGEQGFGGDSADAGNMLLGNGAVAFSDFDGPGEGVCRGRLDSIAAQVGSEGAADGGAEEGPGGRGPRPRGGGGHGGRRNVHVACVGQRRGPVVVSVVDCTVGFQGVVCEQVAYVLGWRRGRR